MRVETDATHIKVYLADGRALFPLDWDPCLIKYRTPSARAAYELWDEGEVIAWPDLDAILSHPVPVSSGRNAVATVRSDFLHFRVS